MAKNAGPKLNKLLIIADTFNPHFNIINCRWLISALLAARSANMDFKNRPLQPFLPPQLRG